MQMVFVFNIFIIHLQCRNKIESAKDEYYVITQVV